MGRSCYGTRSTGAQSTRRTGATGGVSRYGCLAGRPVRPERASSDLDLPLLFFFLTSPARRAQGEYQFSVCPDELRWDDRIDLLTSHALLEAVEESLPELEGGAFVSAVVEESSMLNEIGHFWMGLRVKALPAFGMHINRAVAPYRYLVQRLPKEIRGGNSANKCFSALRRAVANADPAYRLGTPAAARHAESPLPFFSPTSATASLTCSGDRIASL